MIIKKFWKYLFPVTISRSEIVDDDDKVKSYLTQQDFLKKRNKIILVIILVLSLAASWFLYNVGFLSKDGFSTIFAAIVGGFVGSSISYIVQSK